jgi:hypothetical protein
MSDSTPRRSDQLPEENPAEYLADPKPNKHEKGAHVSDEASEPAGTKPDRDATGNPKNAGESGDRAHTGK